MSNNLDLKDQEATGKMFVGEVHQPVVLMASPWSGNWGCMIWRVDCSSGSSSHQC